MYWADLCIFYLNVIEKTKFNINYIKKKYLFKNSKKNFNLMFNFPWHYLEQIETRIFWKKNKSLTLGNVSSCKQTNGTSKS